MSGISPRFDDRDINTQASHGVRQDFDWLVDASSKLKCARDLVYMSVLTFSLPSRRHLMQRSLVSTIVFLVKAILISQLDFTDGRSILITYVQKVFNGCSVFGLDTDGENVGIFLWMIHMLV